MKLWRSTLANGPKWIARCAALLVGVALLLETAHAMGLLEAIPFSENHVTDAILVATFILGFLLIEEFSQTEKHVEHLSEQFEVSANVSRFSDPHHFHSHWKHMRETYGSFTVAGNPAANFSEEFQKLQIKQKRCAFYLDVDLGSQALARSFLGMAHSLPDDYFRLQEFAFPIKGSWILAHDDTGNGVEALLCYPQRNETSADGLYLTGQAARSFAACTVPTLMSRNVGGEAVGPVRIYSEEQIDLVLNKKSVFSQEMLDVDNGIRLVGVEDVCRDMERQLERTRTFLDVTHVCSEKTIPLLRSEQFVSWIAANYAAAQRGVVINRVFILPRALRKNADLLAVVQEMRSKGLHISFCDREGLEPRFIEDFSLYDDRRVIYISREGGPWLDEDQTKARSCDCMDRVRHFRNIFNTVKQRSN
jgi:hypothetical protein